MAEINHRYLKDNDNDIFFPITHIDAVQGIDQESTDNALTDMNDKISQINTLIDNANKTIAEQKKIIESLDVTLNDIIGDTGWVEISVPPDNKNTAQSSGFKCSVREVRAGNTSVGKHFVVRSIRLNVGGIIGASMQIAKLPIGFITDNQSFIARGYGYRHPITIECLSDGKVTAYVHPDDQTKTNWVYQEFTWLE
ncbi:hypothetical protein [Staphylococcus sp. GDY8P19P]|uniref:hypothetical protein n=1 Tax=Staphylococcus sp. GDY8P19P TaxID=2804415 RepID=UPI0019517E44|nr:hypothetical protein [Staphylococcus sp. GDY8P19P]